MTSMAAKLEAAVLVPLKPVAAADVRVVATLVVYADISEESLPDPPVATPESTAPFAKTNESLPLLPKRLPVVLTSTLKISIPDPPWRFWKPQKVSVPVPERYVWVAPRFQLPDARPVLVPYTTLLRSMTSMAAKLEAAVLVPLKPLARAAVRVVATLVVYA